MQNNTVELIAIGNGNTVNIGRDIEFARIVGNAQILPAIARSQDSLVRCGVDGVIRRHTVGIEHLKTRIDVDVVHRGRQLQIVDLPRKAFALAAVGIGVDRLHALRNTQRLGAAIHRHDRLVHIDERLQA